MTELRNPYIMRIEDAQRLIDPESPDFWGHHDKEGTCMKGDLPSQIKQTIIVTIKDPDYWQNMESTNKTLELYRKTPEGQRPPLVRVIDKTEEDEVEERGPSLAIKGILNPGSIIQVYKEILRPNLLSKDNYSFALEERFGVVQQKAGTDELYVDFVTSDGGHEIYPYDDIDINSAAHVCTSFRLDPNSEDIKQEWRLERVKKASIIRATQPHAMQQANTHSTPTSRFSGITHFFRK